MLVTGNTLNKKLETEIVNTILNENSAVLLNRN